MTKEKGVESLQQALDKALLREDSDAIILCYEKLIGFYHNKREFSQCTIYARSLIPHLSKQKMIGKLAKNLSFLGKCYAMIDEFEKAEETHLQALQIYQDMNSELGIAEVETDIGLLNRHRGVYDISLKHLSKALDIYDRNQELMQKENNAGAWLSYESAIECCGVIYGQLHQPEKSLQYLENTLQLKERRGNIPGQISTLMNLGVTHSESDPDKAQEYYLKALALMDDSTPVYLRVVLLNNLGGCLEDANNLDGALKYYLGALSIMERTDQFHYQAPILKHVGTVYFKQGKYDEALAEISKSLETSTKTGAKAEIKDCYLLLSDIYIAKSEYKTALDYRVKYDQVKEEVFQQDLSVQLSELQKKYEKSSLQASCLQHEKSLITEELKKTMNTGFVGVSSSIREVKRLAMEAAMHKDTRVLITGESGVGKEIVARLIHYSDPLNKGRFVDVNCCSIPESMAESEFFGYVRGAFTGALNSKSGILEEADNGTLFLDEIGDMPMLLQSKLLRVLETHQIKRLGSNKDVPVNFRLVSATNRKISELISENMFRVDLMYRINTLEIFIPPLRERKDDIEPLLNYYLTEYANRMNKAVPSYDKALLNWLCEYSFPGNVRELRNIIERVMIFLNGNKLSMADFACQMPTECCVIKHKDTPHGNKLQNIEENALLSELKACNGNQTQAARNLGIPYSTFKRKYKKLRNP